MSRVEKADLLIERGADRLEELSRKAAAKGGFAAKFADDLAEDADFLRKLKPSLIKDRAKSNAATDQQAGTGPDGSSPAAPEATAPPSAAEEATATPAEPVTPAETMPVAAPPVTAEVAPPRAQPAPQPKGGRRRKGPNPFVVAGVALVAGIMLAKVIDWRSHAYPRD